MLHVTNGDATVERLRDAGFADDIIAWRDALHEGPVPAGLAPDALGDVRARYIAEQGWATFADARHDLARRDATLARVAAHDEVVLWFEHDLYDQLQLLQVLDRLAGCDLAGTKLSLICVGAFPGVERFLGLGQLEAAQIASLFPRRRAVTAGQLALARDAWAAFRSPDPSTIARLLGRDTSALPFLRGALIRHLEQFPAVSDGLSRTERQILTSVAAGARTPVDVFLADQALEEHPFMGDTIVWAYLVRLGADPRPLVAFAGDGRGAPKSSGADPDALRQQTVALTPHAHDVLGGRVDRLADAGIDRWLGGVHLSGADSPWRWDGHHRRLIPA